MSEHDRLEEVERERSRDRQAPEIPVTVEGAIAESLEPHEHFLGA